MAEKVEQNKRVKSAQPIFFVVTGFGKFNGVPENPTTKIIDELSSFIDRNNSFGEVS